LYIFRTVAVFNAVIELLLQLPVEEEELHSEVAEVVDQDVVAQAVAVAAAVSSDDISASPRLLCLDCFFARGSCSFSAHR
jgi:hypothetical protein